MINVYVTITGRKGEGKTFLGKKIEAFLAKNGFNIEIREVDSKRNIITKHSKELPKESKLKGYTTLEIINYND